MLRPAWLALPVMLSLPLGPLAAQQGTLEGAYRFVQDQPSGTAPSEGAEVLLSFGPRGQLDITLQRPGEVVTDTGTYRVNGERISLELPAVGTKAQDGAWRLQDDLLTLPFQLFSDEAGTSQWRRVKAEGGAVQVFFDRVNDGLEGGAAPAEAAAQAAEAAKAADQHITACEVAPQGEACVMTYDDGHRECLLVATKTATERQPTPLPMGPMAGDPRTHLVCQPRTAPDDPPNKTAIIWAPFDTAPYYAYEDSLWSSLTGGPRPMVGKVHSFQETGEDLPLLERKLRSAHYEVKVVQDRAATAKALHEAIMAVGGNPGVLYISSHGARGGGLIATGAFLGTAEAESRVHKFGTDPECQRVVRETFPPGYERTAEAHGIDAERQGSVVAMWFQTTRRVPVAFVGISSAFINLMRTQDGADFSRSFVYDDCCNSADDQRLLEAFGARAYLGHTGPVQSKAAAAEAKYMFSALRRPTVCVTEAVGRMRHAIEAQQSVYPEDQLLAEVPMEQHERLKLFGPPKQAPGVEDLWDPLEKPPVPDAIILYLCWMARWSAQDPEGGAKALDDAYEQYWSKGHFSALASPFATAGVVGQHVPTQEEVLAARHLVCGDPTMPYGRFTLNDGDPTREKEADE